MNDFDEQEVIRRLERLGAILPAPDLTRHALDRVRRSLEAEPVPNRVAKHKFLLRRFAAVAAVLLLGVGMFAWLWPATGPARAAFAEVQAAMQSSHSVTCRQVTRIKGEPDESVRMLILGNGLWRTEESDGSYTIMDIGKHRVLMVDSQKREAKLVQGWNTPRVNLYEYLKNLPNDTSAKALPGKKLDGKEVLGFVVKMSAAGPVGSPPELTVWVDAKIRLPVRIEVEGKDDGKAGEIIMDEFVFDKELDAKLFAFEPPAGYKLETEGVAELPAAPADPQLKDLVVTPLVGIGPVKFGMSRPEVERLLGKPDGVQEQGQHGFVNMNYGSRGCFIGVSKVFGATMISCVAQVQMAVRVRDFSGKTDKGIALGASIADIIRVYGEPDSKETNMGSTYLTYNKLDADFTLFGDKLVGMMFQRPRPAK